MYITTVYTSYRNKHLKCFLGKRECNIGSLSMKDLTVFTLDEKVMSCSCCDMCISRELFVFRSWYQRILPYLSQITSFLFIWSGLSNTGLRISSTEKPPELDSSLGHSTRAVTVHIRFVYVLALTFGCCSCWYTVKNRPIGKAIRCTGLDKV